MDLKLRHGVRSRKSPPPVGAGCAVSAVIPAYNEEGRVGSVLGVLHQVAELREIIVVDDGSSDATWDDVKQAAALDPRIRGMRHPVNRGKGAAMFTGARAAQSDLLLFLDADLVRLAPVHVRALLRPVCQNEADMTLGLFCSWHLNTTLAHWITPWLSGQRCVRTTLFLQTSEQNAAGYGAETALSLTARRNHWRCRHVLWPGVYHPPSEMHRGGWRGLNTRAGMYGDVWRAWRAERGWMTLGSSLRLFLLAAIFVLGMTWLNGAYHQPHASSTAPLGDLMLLPSSQRVLVVAPPPGDDLGRLVFQALPDESGDAADSFPKLTMVETGSRRWPIGSTDAAGLSVGRLGDELWLTAKTRAALAPGLHYRIIVRSPNGRTPLISWLGAAARTCRLCVTATWNLQELGRPALLVVEAEVWQGATLGWTAWHIVRLRNGPR
jgi:hypothetical protein